MWFKKFRVQFVYSKNPSHFYFENGQGKLKETNWFSFYSYDSQVLKPQFEEGITEIKWVQKKYLQFYLNKSFRSIEELFKIFF